MERVGKSIQQKLFEWIVAHPKRMVFFGIALIALFISFLPQIVKDTRSDAFLSPDNPALLYRQQVKEIFGLSDPMVIAVLAEGSIFTAEGLNTVSLITEAVGKIKNVDPDGITSLATENNIIGTEEGMDVEPFYEHTFNSQAEADSIRDAIRNFPLYQGTLVANDESAALIVLEMLDEDGVESAYLDILETVNALEIPSYLTVHVAGEGAVSGYMGSYIDADAFRLNPVAGLIITIIVFIAFRRFSSTLMANMVVAASVITTMGAMAASGTPFYVITNAMPVILIGISVADSIHIFSEYFERRARFPDESYQNSVVESMLEMWRPVTLTTLTTAAGFIGLYFAAYMPPFQAFGLFTAFGVAMAWVFSLFVLPAAMSLIKADVSPALAKLHVSNKHDFFARSMIKLGALTVRHAKGVVVLSVLMVVVGVFAASNLTVNEKRIDTFHKSEAIYHANEAINEHFNGTTNLDIVIETNEAEGIFEPEVLKKIEALQSYVETLPDVQGSTSVVDYLKQMNKSLNEGKADFYSLPGDRDLVAQYFLLYSVSGDPTDFEEEVDFDYRLANVRVTLNEDAYIRNKLVIEDLEHYLLTEFNTDQVSGKLSGRMNLNYHWIKNLGVSHFSGMAIALLLVWLVSALLFRSPIAGLYALTPIAISILFVYTFMVLFGISLGMGTSMFSAVAIGLGVDFAIHTIDRIKSLNQKLDSIPSSLKAFYPSTGRALFFNLLALALGFGVLVSSKVVPLNNFGLIVALSVTTSFLVSMTLVPAMIYLFKPRFVWAKNVVSDTAHTAGYDKAQDNQNGEGEANKGVVSPTIYLAVFAVGVSSVLAYSPESGAQELPEGRWIAEQVNAVDEGLLRSSHIQMTLIDRRGKERIRETKVYRKYFGEEKRTVLFYLSPRNVKNTGFLTYDYPDENIDDDQWLYLPALRKARRISASDRGDYFLGTDLTYEDMKREGKLSLSDYQFKTLREEVIEGTSMIMVEAIPASQEISQELGYGKVALWVDKHNWVIMKAKYWDVNLNELKSLEVGDVRLVDGIWTRHILRVVNHKTGHQTNWQVSEVDYKQGINDKLFTKNALTRGAPK